MLENFDQSSIHDFLEVIPEPILACDNRGKIVFVNCHAQQFFGYSKKELIGQSIEFLIPEHLRGIHQRHRSRYHIEPKVRSMSSMLDLRAQKKDGTQVPVEISLSPVQTKNGTIIFAALRDVSRRLQRQVLQTTEDVQHRIGQELHDGLGQQLTAVSYMARLLEKKLEAKNLSEAKQASEILHVVKNSIEQVRRFAHELYPVELKAQGLVAVLQELADNTQKTCKLCCRFVLSVKNLNLSAQESLQLYRIAQEALNNALKHSCAKMIIIRLERKNKKTILSVQDDGVGIQKIAVSNEGIGLHLMRYRVQSLGGQFRVKSLSPGTKIIAEF